MVHSCVGKECGHVGIIDTMEKIWLSGLSVRLRRWVGQPQLELDWVNARERGRARRVFHPVSYHLFCFLRAKLGVQSCTNA